jgi:HEXXH motif-containing protein
MATDVSIVSNITGSAEQTARYWRALQKRGLSQLKMVPASDVPVRSYLWPHLIYGETAKDAIAEASLARWFELEQEELSGLPMRDPKSFLQRLGDRPLSRFSCIDGELVRAAPNDKLKAAHELIAEIWPEAAGEFSEALLGVAWIDSPSQRIQIESSSDPKRFGVIFLKAAHFRTASHYELATALIHEAAHHALFVETAIDPLIPTDFKTSIFSPLRREMRPAIGVLHAVFTIARMGQWAKRLSERRPTAGISDELARIRGKYISGLRATLVELRRVRFSPRGERMLREISDLVDPLESIRG